MKNIAVITARSGSKGLKDKNIRLLCGKELMAYSIEAALESAEFDEVMVSTDSEVYADIAIKHGAKVPFLRSSEMSSDKASSWDTVEEVLTKYEKLGRNFDSCCLLQPTSPLRTAEDIRAAYRIFRDKAAVAVIGMTMLEHPLSWCGLLGEEDSLNGFTQRDCVGQRQEQKTYYRPNGAIFIVSVPEIKKDKFFYREGCYAYLMPHDRSVDIDNEFDFKFAEFLLKNNEA